ncbi:F0F1 ATP synthase subunit gamma [Yoonia sp.]|uniref:F0F1 ATP synthase subunit gamma n=1 Tax=Yoonia sp. TaxID=2212373 RepID=UPI0019F97C23|nr:F0F1 ATP synthase subunit gamma [Yoonia sp.]MBE0413963.1 F0F1 ATP synthase subunit gamma [Yoonia sp.]
METLETLSAALRTAQDIQSIVRTMKALSAVSIHQYETAETALGDYADTIDLGLSAVLQQQHADGIVQPAGQDARTGREALIVIGSDRGLCGQYNEVVSRRAIAEISEQDPLLGVLGARAAARLEAAGQVPQTLLAVPASVEGFTATVQSVIVTIDAWADTNHLRRVRLLHNRRKGQHTAQPVIRQLLPIPQDYLTERRQAKWPGPGLPFFRMDKAALMSWLVRERLFVMLYRALAEALASEHATRLAAMQNAARTLQDRQDTLNAALRQKRQETITRELLDLVAGYETAQATS